MNGIVPLLCCLFFTRIGCAGTSETSAACIRDSQDPYDPAQVFTQGAFKGECVDASSVRPVLLLSEDIAQLKVAGFYDQGKFWLAEVPKNAVTRVLFQIVPFASGVPLIQAAHTQLRFLFKPGIEISLLAQSSASSEKSSANDVIVSSTFTSPKGIAYSALKSFGGSFGMVTRLLTSFARGKEEIQVDKSIVRQFELRLTEEEKNRLFILVLKRASADGYRHTYDLFAENCTTTVFDALDAVRAPPQGVRPVRGDWWHLFDEFIQPSIQALQQRHLIDDKSEIQPMNDEMKF